MITLIHLLEHIGLPSGVAIALVIAGKKALTGGISKGRQAPRQRPRSSPWLPLSARFPTRTVQPSAFGCLQRNK
jgi:hypothetical protein